jgi:hypothetical protein
MSLLEALQAKKTGLKTVTTTEKTLQAPNATKNEGKYYKSLATFAIRVCFSEGGCVQLKFSRA